ncbi:Cysteine-rich receptor-like protein kinase [Ancistrocladus abbreviatus]
MPPLTFLFLFPLILMIQIHRTQSAAPTSLKTYCPSTTATFAANSIYQKSLNNLLSSLASNATQANGFYNATSGGSGRVETIYGIFLCHGDDTTDVCKTCVNRAISDLTENCRRSKEVIIWYDECLVRYSNKSFFGQLDDGFVFGLVNTQNITGNVTEFMQLLSDTLNTLAVKAANGGSGKKFTTMEAKYNSFQTLHTLAQCTPDLSENDCIQCLRKCIGTFPRCCNGRLGGRVIFPSRNMRFEIYPFYSVTAAPPPKTPAPLLSPPALRVNKIETAEGGVSIL